MWRITDFTWYLLTQVQYWVILPLLSYQFVPIIIDVQDDEDFLANLTPEQRKQLELIDSMPLTRELSSPQVWKLNNITGKKNPIESQATSEPLTVAFVSYCTLGWWLKASHTKKPCIGIYNSTFYMPQHII